MGASEDAQQHFADEAGAVSHPSEPIQRQFSGLRTEKSIGPANGNNNNNNSSLQRQSSRALTSFRSGDLRKPLLRSKSKGFTSQPSTATPVLFTLVVVLGSLSLGLALGYTSPTQADIIHDLRWSLSEYSFFGSLVNLGAMIGAVSSGKIADILGRKGAFVAAALPNLLGWTMISMSSDLYVLYAARFLKGFGGGIVSFAVPTYIAETAPKHLRGTLGTMHQLAVTVGIMLAYLGGLFFRWRALALVATVPAFMLLVGLFFITETPRWLGSQERNEDLVFALHRLRGKEYNISSELSEIQNAVEVSKLQPDVRLSELFTRRLLRPLLAGVGLQAFQQLSGINAVMLYAGEIFKTVGFKSANTASLILALLQVLVTLSAAVLMDKAGRRLLLLVSSAGMALGTFLVGLSFHLRQNMQSSTSGMDTFINVLALCSLLFYVASFAFGLGAIPWIIMSEVFPARVKGMAGSVATLVNWSCAWLVTLTFNFLLNWSSQGSFWIFGTVCLCNIAFVAIFVPETRGRSLEQIEASLK